MIRNILANINNYNKEMSISQVIRFFDSFGMSFTKTMIQNYIRVGIMPPPVRKRYYVKNHLILLAMIYELKEIYSLPEIGHFFETYIKSDDEDELVDMYNEYLSLYDEHYKRAKPDKTFSLMVQSIAVKKLLKI